jgi:outer membrane protein assembly factor BamA
VLLLVPWGAAAQEADGFRIETITVEGGRRAATQGIVVTESQLATGKAWSERELREAIYRIRRLPFIVHADFALRRGTARGLYALVITVEETRPFFFSADTEVISTAQTAVAKALGYGESETNLRHTGTAGARIFLGSNSALFGLVDSSAGVQAGYTRYGLFGRGGSATLSVARHFFCCQDEAVPLGLDPGFVTWSTENGTSAAASVVLPLAGNQSLRAEAAWSRRDAGSRRGLLDDPLTNIQFFSSRQQRISRAAEVKWFYDTADDPLFPSHGTTLSAGVELADQTVPVRLPGSSFLVDSLTEGHSRLVALAATGRQSWSLSPSQTVSLGGRLAAGRSRIEHLLTGDRLLQEPVDLDTLEASVEARYSAGLWGFDKLRELGDLRFELGARYGYESTSPSFGGPVRQLSVGPSIAFRNGWGVFRFGFSYLNFQRSKL